MTKYPLLENLLYGKFSLQFHLIRSKDIECYNIEKIVNGFTLDQSILGLTAQLRMAVPDCQKFVEDHGLKEFYEVVEVANLFLLYEASDLEDLPPTYKLKLSRFFKEYTKITRLRAFFPKTYDSMLVLEDIPLTQDDVATTFSKHTHDNSILTELGLLPKLFGYFCDIMNAIYRNIQVSPISHGYGPGNQLYICRMSSEAHGVLPSGSGYIISSSSLLEARLKFAMMYLSESVNTVLFDKGFSMKDKYHSALKARYSAIKGAIKNAK